MRKDFSNGIGTHIKSAPLVMDHVQVSGFGKGFAGRKTESGTGWLGLARAGLLDEVVRAIHLVMPGAAMPMVVTREVEHARPLDVQRDVPVVGELVEEMAGVGAFVAAAAVVGAAHIGPRADPLAGPALPQAIRIQTHGNDRRLLCRGRQQAGTTE